MASILLLFFSLYFSGSEAATFKISVETKDYFKNNFKEKCNFDQHKERQVRAYIKCDLDEIYVGSEDICSMMIDYYVKQDCTEDFKKVINTKLKQDKIPYHKERLRELREEITDFRERKLPASAQIENYLNYKDINELGNEIQIDPAIVELKEKELKRFLKRKDSCSDTVNIKDPLELKKPRNQGAIGWCYAYTASDLIAHATGKNPSSMQLSSLMNSKWFSRLIELKEGGFVDTTIEEAIKKGICLDKDLPDAELKISKYNSSLKAVVNQSASLSKKYKNRTSSNYGENSLPVDNSKDYTRDSIIKELCSQKDFLESAGVIFPNLKVDQIADILFTELSTDGFKKMIEASCPVVKYPELDNIKVTTALFDKMSKIDDQLSKGNIVGIHYNAGVLVNDYKSKENLPHASSIIGRRFNYASMSCEYLIRNSWGNTCGGYREDLTCDHGNIWVPEDNLKYTNSIFEIIYVEKK